jgi:uncharacterized cupin superfamily protein
MLGAARLGMTVYELPPGEAICPYHFHWGDEEWLIVVAGTPTLRTPDGETALEARDVVCFPVGPAGAHRVDNAGDETVRVALVSNTHEFGIIEYPDSDKIGIWGRHDEALDHMIRRSQTSTTGKASANGYRLEACCCDVPRPVTSDAVEMVPTGGELALFEAVDRGGLTSFCCVARRWSGCPGVG